MAANELGESREVIRNYESNLERLSMEIQRLNNVLRLKVAEIDELKRRFGEMEYEYRKSEAGKKENDELRAKNA